MASSVSGICSSSPSLKPKTPAAKPSVSGRREAVSFPSSSKLVDRAQSLSLTRSVAREISSDLAKADGAAGKEKRGLVKDSRSLWGRYVGWLYQHKELGLYLDVSRIGFTDEFVEGMEPRFQAAFKAMEEMEKGAIANPDEGRMVGHYWLRKSELAPTRFLKAQIENTLDAVCNFAADVVSGKVSSGIPALVARRVVRETVVPSISIGLLP